MLIKLLNPIVKFLFNFWTSKFVICPYIGNEAKYMAKGVKPFSTYWDGQEFLEDYVFPKFDPLVKKGIILEQRKNLKLGKLDLIRVHYYYAGEEWRVKRFEILFNNYLAYKRSCPIREGVLFGYPKKYIRRHRLNSKIGRWLYEKGFRTHPLDK